MTSAQQDAVVREFDFSKGAQGWRPTNNLSAFDLKRGVLATRATGNDANLTVSGLRVPCDEVTHVTFRMKSDQPGGTQVYFATTEFPSFAANAVPTVSCAGGGTWREYAVKMPGAKGFEGVLTHLRLDPVNSAAGRTAQIEIAWIRLVKKAPRLLFECFSSDKPFLERGERATVRLRIRNVGGPIDGRITAVLAATAPIRVAAPAQPMVFKANGEPAEASWGIEAEAVGYSVLTAQTGLDGRPLLTATATVHVPADDQLGITEEEALILRAGAATLSLLPGADGKTDSALLSVAGGAEPRPVALLTPLCELVTTRSGEHRAETVRFTLAERDARRLVLRGEGHGLSVGLTIATHPGAGQFALSTRAEALDEGIQLWRFAAPTLRVGLGADGVRKEGGLFPGQEFLAHDEPSSNIKIVGPFLGHRPHPDPRTITVPALAVLKDKVLTGMMWDPLQDWGAGAAQGAMPVAEFASPNFLDNQPNHLIGCFVPDAPWRKPSDPVARTPCDLRNGEAVRLDTRLFALPGKELTDVVPLWYSTYGMPEPPAPARADEETLDLLMKGYAQTLFDEEQRGFTSHFKHGKEQPRWISAYAARVLTHALRTGDRRWARRIGLNDGVSLVGVMGSLFRGPAIPPAPEQIDSQSPQGLWAFHTRFNTHHDVAKYSNGFSTVLGDVGAVYNGFGLSHYAHFILGHAVAWGDERSVASGLKALRAGEAFKIPRGAQTWEVPAGTPDLYGAARIADCYLMGYELTKERRYLAQARYWLYTGLPFLYAYRVPTTGPGVRALVSWPEHKDTTGDVYYRDVDRHHSTPWGSIPVFGTSLYRVNWFGTLVQFEGLVWALSVHDYLRYADEPLLRTAAQGVIRVGANITLDKEPYAGLLPDGFDTRINRAQGALIGPMRLEPPLRALMDRPSLSGIRHTVVLTDFGRHHLHSRSIISHVVAEVSRWSWRQRYLPGQTCETMVVHAGRMPSSVTVESRVLPRVQGLLEAQEGWAPLPDVKGFGFRFRQRTETETVGVQF